MSNWTEVDHAVPCEVCGKEDWCRRTVDGDVALCRRVSGGTERTDVQGQPYWLYTVSGGARRAPEHTQADAGPAPPCADPDQLHAVYSALLDLLTLRPHHHKNLRARGFKDDGEIERRGYRTLPPDGRAKTALALVKRFGEDLCATVPGLYLRAETTPYDGNAGLEATGGYWVLAGCPGILVPCRDPAGRIVALKIRADDADGDLRYTYLSSSRHGGPGVVADAHLPPYECPTPGVVRLTEGELKADVATLLTGVLTVSVPGVSHWRRALPVLQHLGVRTVYLAYDADWRDKPAVKRALWDTCVSLQEAGYEVMVESWDEVTRMPDRTMVDTKGIDDLLVRTSRNPALLRPGEAIRPSDLADELVEDFRDFKRLRGRYVCESKKEGDQVLSNWVATPTERLFLEDKSEVLRVQLRLVGQAEPVVHEFAGEALVDHKGLIRALPSTEWVWTGSDRHVQMLRAYWKRTVNDVPLRQATDVVGRCAHPGSTPEAPKGDILVLPQGVFDADGPMDPAPLSLVGIQRVNHIKKLDLDLDPRRLELARRVALEHLPRLNVGAVMVPVVGWIGALPWASLFRAASSRWGGFPHLFIWGTHGAGKTSLGHVAWRMCGVPPTAEPISLPQTKFVRINALSSSNTVPAWFDEYRPSAWDDGDGKRVSAELRSTYGGEVEYRGQANLGFRAYRLQAPILVSGESLTTDSATLERILVVNPNPDSLGGQTDENEFKRAFRAIGDAPLESLALPYWMWCLRQHDWQDRAEAARQEVCQNLRDARVSSLPARAVNNLSICLFGLNMLQEFLGQPLEFQYSTVRAALHAQATALFPEGVRRTALDQLLQFAANHLHRELQYGQHWVMVAGSKVVLRLSSVVDELCKVARQQGGAREVLDDRAYLQQARELSGKDTSYVINHYDKAKFSGNQSLRGISLDAGRIEKHLGIDWDLWRSRSEVPANSWDEVS